MARPRGSFIPGLRSPVSTIRYVRTVGLREVDMTVRHSLKEAARSAAREAIKSGSLVPGPCEVPGCVHPVNAHHDDYNQPLKVRWFCRRHHYDWHEGWDVDQMVLY